MATTTPNYGWAVPTSTDLVKDGATAIETLGDAIDASMNTALGTKKAGMVLLNTTSFSAVASQALPTGSFVSTYKNYRVIWRHFQNTTNGNMSLRFRASGVNDTGANYQQGGIYAGITSATTRVNVTGATSLGVDSVNTGNYFVVILDVTSPQQALQTVGFMNAFSTSRGDCIAVAIQHTGATSFDSIDFISSAGTMTGQVSVYGYNE